MRIWNYIGEFFLFRWLFGSHKHDEPKRDLLDICASFDNKDIVADDDTHTGFSLRHDNSYYRYDKYDYGSQSYDDFLDEQDDYDMMNDL